MPIPIDRQIEALVDAWEREISRLHLGASPYDDDPDEEAWAETRKGGAVKSAGCSGMTSAVESRVRPPKAMAEQ